MKPESTTPSPPDKTASKRRDRRLVRLRAGVEALRTDPTKIPAFETMGWDEACSQILALIDEANDLAEASPDK